MSSEMVERQTRKRKRTSSQKQRKNGGNGEIKEGKKFRRNGKTYERINAQPMYERCIELRV